MKQKTQLILVGIFLLVFSFGCFIFNTDKENENEISSKDEVNDKSVKEIEKNTPKISKGFTRSFIHVTGTNWTQTDNDYDWCYKENNFYVIENVTINAGERVVGY